MNSLTLLLNFLMVFLPIAYAENPIHADEILLREIAPETTFEHIITKLQSINCDVLGLSAFLKEELIESERKLTENLDDKLRERYKYHEKTLLPEERSEIFSLAQTGTMRILERFKTKWKNISDNLSTHSNPRMKAVGKAIQPVIMAIHDEYEKMISDFERNKNSTVNFAGIGCAACKVGYLPLNKGLKEQNLTRATKDSGQCATFDGNKVTFNEKSFAVGIHPNTGQVMLSDPGKTIQRPIKLPEEMLILNAIHNYYEVNKEKYSDPLAIKQIESFSKLYAKLTERKDGMKILKPLLEQVDQIKSQDGKFRATVKWLKDLGGNDKGAMQELLDWSEQMYNDSSRSEERKRLHVRLGIPDAAIVKLSKVLNAWAKGYGVDYSLMENGPSGHNKDSNKEILNFVKSTLGGPSSEANNVLKWLTGACFYCDAAMWAQLQF